MISLFLIALVILVALSSFFSATETALFSLSSMQVKAYAQAEDVRKKLVVRLLQRPADLLVTLLMLNTIANILIQNVCSSLFGSLSGWLLTVGVPLAITMIFGEVIPKSIGLSNNTRISLAAGPTVQFFDRLFLPIRRALTAITHRVVRWEFFFLKKEEQISLDELRHALKTSYAGGVLNTDEAELVRGYLNLEEASVKELMRPREEVLLFDLEEPIERLISLFADEECSRIPVCREGLDKVIGIMSAATFFTHRPTISSTQDLLALLKKPFFVPESLPARILFRQFYDRKESIAMVVDEYGSVSGLIALEDLVEVVVGEISDRRDEKQRFSRSGQDVIIASGKMELTDLEEMFGVHLSSANHMVTVGGWLTERLGDIPRTGTKLTYENLLFHVIAADPTRVRRVYIRRLKPSSKRL